MLEKQAGRSVTDRLESQKVWQDGIKKSFGRNLRKWREANGQTQEDVADFLDISVRQYMRYESGESFPNRHVLMMFASDFLYPTQCPKCKHIHYN